MGHSPSSEPYGLLPRTFPSAYGPRPSGFACAATPLSLWFVGKGACT